eukprot:scaffold14524_cov81-Isochrysis_galbana.AAC.1
MKQNTGGEGESGGGSPRAAPPSTRACAPAASRGSCPAGGSPRGLRRGGKSRRPPRASRQSSPGSNSRSGQSRRRRRARSGWRLWDMEPSSMDMLACMGTGARSGGSARKGPLALRTSVLGGARDGDVGVAVDGPHVRIGAKNAQRRDDRILPGHRRGDRRAVCHITRDPFGARQFLSRSHCRLRWPAAARNGRNRVAALERLAHDACAQVARTTDDQQPHDGRHTMRLGHFVETSSCPLKTSRNTTPHDTNSYSLTPRASSP